jgi:endoglucanase
VVRLPVNFVGYTDDRLDPKLLRFLDQAVDGLLAAGFIVVLDNHSDPLDPRIRFRLEGFLTSLWTQLATHYRDRPPGLFYEIQNEPHEIVAPVWDNIQHKVLAALRRVDAAHIVVVTGADWGSAPALSKLSAYDDPRLVYTFHCYDPFRFTHQGAAWAGQATLSGVRFPGPGDKAALARTLDGAVAFAKSRSAPVWCGEFGVYNLKADSADRVEWYRTFRTLLDERALPWTMWDYQGSFGLFTKDSAEVFDQDLNLPLVEALGFHSPAQRPPGPVVETAGFYLYRDGWQPGTRRAGFHRQGVVDAYDEN